MLEQYGHYNWDTQVPMMGAQYNVYNHFEIDTDKLASLGFTVEEIQTLQYVISTGGKITPSALVSYGLDYETARRIKYMYDIAVGRVSIVSVNDLCKHLRKLFGAHGRIGIQHLALSKVKKVPRLAVIGGMPKGPYEIYNSKNYTLHERVYNVQGISNNRVLIKTKRKPVLPYGSEKKVYYVRDLETNRVQYYYKKDEISPIVKKDSRYKDGVALEIKELLPDKQVIISVDKNYCRLINRYIIVASLKRPEFHCGMVEIVCIEGTKVYVYCSVMGKGETVSYRGGTQRVYDHGFIPGEIQPKLMKAAEELYKTLCGVFAVNIPANQDFHIIDSEQNLLADTADGVLLSDNAEEEEYEGLEL